MENETQHTTVILYVEPNDSLRESLVLYLRKNAEVIETSSIEVALDTIVRRTDINFFLLRHGAFYWDDEYFLLKKAHEINSTIGKTLIEVPSAWKSKNEATLRKFAIETFPEGLSEEDLIFTMQAFEADAANKGRRKYNRAKWPLTASIRITPDGPKTVYNVLSISANGAFLRASEQMPELETTALAVIEFKEFKVMTDIKVVWLNENGARPDYPRGFAVTFLNLSPASQKIVDEIVRDKLLRVITFEYFHKIQ